MHLVLAPAPAGLVSSYFWQIWHNAARALFLLILLWLIFFHLLISVVVIVRIYRVPDILFTTIEPPSDLPIIGKGCFIQARICRPKKEGRGEANAKEISDVSQQTFCIVLQYTVSQKERH